MKRTWQLKMLCWFAVCAATLSVVGEKSQAAIVYTADAPYPANPVVFTVDPAPITNANRGLTTTRRLFQTFQNPQDVDVRQITLSFRVTNASTGLRIKFHEVADVNTSPLVLGTEIHSLDLPVGTYGTSSQRIGLTLSGSDVFTLPQRDTGTTGYAIEISQIDQVTTVVSGNLFYSDVTVPVSTDFYPFGKVFQENFTNSNARRDAGLGIAAPEPASLALVVLGCIGLAMSRRGAR